MILGITISLLFFGISLRYQKIAYSLIVALLPVYLFRFNIFNIPTTALELMVGVFLFAVLITSYNRAVCVKIRSLGKINWAILGFILAGVISTVASPEPIRALGQLKAFIIEPVLFFYATITVFKNKKEFAVALKFLFASITAISLFGLVQYWTHLFLPLRFWGYGNEVKRITSVFEYPNALALYLAPLFIFFLTLYFKKVKMLNITWMSVGLILTLIAVLLTYSRGAWLGIIAGVGLLVATQQKISFKKWGVTIAVALFLASPILISRMKLTLNDGASHERLELFRVAANKIINNPLLGNGLYGFRQTLMNSNYNGEILNYPHNIILNFWLETGLLGLLSFAFIIYAALKKYGSKPNILGIAAALSIFTMFIHGMVDVPYFKNDLSIIFWTLISIFYIDE